VRGREKPIGEIESSKVRSVSLTPRSCLLIQSDLGLNLTITLKW
jgi:hypothetical protein